MKLGAAAMGLVCLAAAGCGRRGDTVVVGSKNFPEQALLGEIVAQQLEAHTHLHVERRFYLAGTFICQQAILAGRIDTYVEYSGTALTAILHDPVSANPARVLAEVRAQYRRRFHLAVLPPLGFDNSFAIVIRGADARRWRLSTISQAARYTPRWHAGFGYEFLSRPDGYAGLVRTYDLRFAAPPRVLDLGLLYRALLDHQVDLVAGNSTDGLLTARDLVVLADDKHYFPPYQAVPIVRERMLARHPEVGAALRQLAGAISDATMRSLNYQVVGQHRPIAEVARAFLRASGVVR